MGLFDDLLGSVMGAATGGDKTQQKNPLGDVLNRLGGKEVSNLLPAAMAMLQKSGGLNGVLDMFRQKGLEKQADSWVGIGSNEDISPDQIKDVFGSSTLNDIASKAGLSKDTAGSALAKLLPELINQLTPKGQVDKDGDDLLSKGLEMLLSKKNV